MIERLLVVVYNLGCHHVAVKLKDTYCVGLGISPLQGFKVAVQHQRNLFPKHTQDFCYTDYATQTCISTSALASLGR